MNSSNKKEPPSNHPFATTSWSLVVQAADVQSPQAQQALEELCQKYWYPLYAFLRRKSYRRSDAEDLTQAFFANLLEKQSLKSSDPDRGRFRTFLMTCLSNFASDQRRRDLAQVRGGGQTILSFDFQAADARFTNEPSHDLTPEKVFDRDWAMTVLEEALRELGNQYSASGKSELFHTLSPYLSMGNQVPYAVVAETLSMTEGAVKVAVHRLRDRYRNTLRNLIAETVSEQDEIDQELSELFSVFES